MEIGKPVKIRISKLRSDEMAIYIYDSTDKLLYNSVVREIYETVNERMLWT